MTDMNGLVLESIGNLKLKRVEKPAPGNSEVLLKVKACGICSSDIPRIFKTGTYHFPTIPGHEFSGVIEEVGENVDESYIGKRAAVFPLLPCFDCEPCRQGQYAQCKNYNYFGSRCDGAFAEYIAVPVWNLVPFDDNLDYEIGALCEPFAVSIHAFEAAGNLSADDNIAIIGTGTIGFMIGLIAKLHGVKNVIMCGRNKSKIEFAQSLGFSTADTSSEDFEKQIEHITGGKGLKTVFEVVGSPASVNLSVKACGTMGEVILVGNPTGDIEFEKAVYWKILRQQITVKGIWNSVYSGENSDWTKAISILENNADLFRKLITHSFTLEQAEEALDTVKSLEKFSLKVMFKI